MSSPTPYGPYTHDQIIPPDASIEEAQSGYSHSDSPSPIVQEVWAYDCYYCGVAFTESATTGPETGTGVMGRSYGLNVVCPRCGSTNTTGPRMANIGEYVLAPNNTLAIVIPGLWQFTGETPGFALVRIG